MCPRRSTVRPLTWGNMALSIFILLVLVGAIRAARGEIIAALPHSDGNGTLYGSPRYDRRNSHTRQISAIADSDDVFSLFFLTRRH